jgi:uncharacterized protein YfaP (DUF2135 family)
VIYDRQHSVFKQNLYPGNSQRAKIQSEGRIAIAAAGDAAGSTAATVQGATIPRLQDDDGIVVRALRAGGDAEQRALVAAHAARGEQFDQI